MKLSRMAVAVGAGLALNAPSAQVGAQDNDTIMQALQVIHRTKVVTATYSSYVWNRITRPGEPVVEEWSAEFHAGSLHRVETPRDRIVADCEKMTGVALSLETGEKVEGPQVAGAACGINTNSPFRSVRLIGPVEGPTGLVERIEVIDRDNVRVYDVTSDGILVRGTYASSETPEALLLESWTVSLERKVPADDMFSEDSLLTSFVPDTFKQAPSSQ